LSLEFAHVPNSLYVQAPAFVQSVALVVCDVQVTDVFWAHEAAFPVHLQLFVLSAEHVSDVLYDVHLSSPYAIVIKYIINNSRH